MAKVDAANVHTRSRVATESIDRRHRYRREFKNNLVLRASVSSDAYSVAADSRPRASTHANKFWIVEQGIKVNDDVSRRRDRFENYTLDTGRRHSTFEFLRDISRQRPR